MNTTIDHDSFKLLSSAHFHLFEWMIGGYLKQLHLHIELYMMALDCNAILTNSLATKEDNLKETHLPKDNITQGELWHSFEDLHLLIPEWNCLEK